MSMLNFGRNVRELYDGLPDNGSIKLHYAQRLTATSRWHVKVWSIFSSLHIHQHTGSIKIYDAHLYGAYFVDF